MSSLQTISLPLEKSAHVNPSIRDFNPSTELPLHPFYSEDIILGAATAYHLVKMKVLD